MNDHTINLSIGLILVLLGCYLLWYSNGHSDFYREKRWERWTWRAAMLGLFFRLIFHYGGAGVVKRSFQIFAMLCVLVGTWAMFAG